MSPQRWESVRFTAAIGAGIGVGMGLYRDFTPALGWQGAMLLGALGSALAALATGVFLQLIAKFGRSTVEN